MSMMKHFSDEYSLDEVEPEYKVELLIDSTYQVVDISDEDRVTVHQGSLADCEAFIRLKNGGYL